MVMMVSVKVMANHNYSIENLIMVFPEFCNALTRFDKIFLKQVFLKLHYMVMVFWEYSQKLMMIDVKKLMMIDVKETLKHMKVLKVLVIEAI